MRSVSQHCADDWIKSPTDTDTTSPVSGIVLSVFHLHAPLHIIYNINGYLQ